MEKCRWLLVSKKFGCGSRSASGPANHIVNTNAVGLKVLNTVKEQKVQGFGSFAFSTG